MSSEVESLRQNEDRCITLATREREYILKNLESISTWDVIERYLCNDTTYVRLEGITSKCLNHCIDSLGSDNLVP